MEWNPGCQYELDFPTPTSPGLTYYVMFQWHIERRLSTLAREHFELFALDVDSARNQLFLVRKNLVDNSVCCVSCMRLDLIRYKWKMWDEKYYGGWYPAVMSMNSIRYGQTILWLQSDLLWQSVQVVHYDLHSKASSKMFKIS